MPFRQSARGNPRIWRKSARPPRARASLIVVLDIVEILAADVVDVDQLAGRDRHGCEPDRDAETDDRATGLDLAEGDLVAKRYRLARDNQCSPSRLRRL